MDFLEAKTNLCSTKLNTNYTDVVNGVNSLFSLQDVNDAVNFGVRKAWDYHPWTFTEGKVSLTLPNPLTAFYAYPVNFEDESIFLIVVNGVAWIGAGNGKRNFTDYIKWLSDYPTDTSPIWTAFGRNYYLYQNTCKSRQRIDIYGKLRSTILVSDTDLLPFSPTSDNYQDSGNEAIILLAFAFLLSSEKKRNPQQAAIETKNAYTILDTVWAPMAERRSQKNPQNKPFFNSGDLFPERRNRFDTNIGNFP